jgi:hypothetical protein
MTHHNFLISLISSAKRSSKQQEKVTGLELSAGISYNQLLLEPKSRGARYVIYISRGNNNFLLQGGRRLKQKGQQRETCFTNGKWTRT